MVEVDGGGSRDDAVVVFGVFLGGLDAHAAAEGTAYEVRFLGVLGVELHEELLGGDGAGVEADSGARMSVWGR
jgi:hypothetical protein